MRLMIMLAPRYEHALGGSRKLKRSGKRREVGDRRMLYYFQDLISEDVRKGITGSSPGRSELQS